MNKVNHPIQSTKSLVKATITAFVLAVVILITAVLPAEYGIDPTGLGGVIGLTVLAPVEDKVEKPSVTSCDDTIELQEGSVAIVVPANSGLEYKLHMEKGTVLDYSWKTNDAALYFDFHGEPQGDTTGYFKSFKETTLAKDSGSQLIPFTGSHGWYWKNETGSAITVFLEIKGVYQVIGLR
ncbi:MAG: hypothetical protein A6F70_08095 [Cycloclasticus sp. symbiont of Bathymodiolus heckerae]|nr:MAG: hypothetical protein A6F70_08095 [Cycloclasticus sp. symbiont of Bathymodiolus heckerae]